MPQKPARVTHGRGARHVESCDMRGDAIQRYHRGMARRSDGRRRRIVDDAVGVDGACTAVVPVLRRNPNRQKAAFAALSLVVFALQFVPFNIVVPAYLVLILAAKVTAEVSLERFLIGATTDSLVVVSIRKFSRRPGGVIEEFPFPADIQLDSKLLSYKVKIDGVTYEAQGHTYPEWLELIEKTGMAALAEGTTPLQFPPRTLDTTTRIAVPVLVALMYTVLIVTNPPWMETIDRAWFVNPATVLAMLGWLTSAVTAAAGWKEGLLVGLGATALGLIAMWGDTLHGYVSFSTPFYAEQVAAIVAFGIGGGPIDELAGRVRAQ